MRPQELESWAAKCPENVIHLETMHSNPKEVRARTAAMTVAGTRKTAPQWAQLAKEGWKIIRLHLREGEAYGARTKK